MTDRIVRPAAATLALALAMIAGATPGLASTHHRATHHRTTHHRSTRPDTAHHRASSQHRPSGRHRPTPSAHHHADKPDAHRDDKPAGVTGVPGGGIKLFCPAHRNPLLIRKSTQGAGTTVTVVCR
jgi:hypothetical protein